VANGLAAPCGIGRAWFSFATLVLPLATVISIALILRGLFDADYMNRLKTVVENPEAWSTYGSAAASQRVEIAIGEFVGRLRFAAPQSLLITISYFTILVALIVTLKMMREHRGCPGWLLFVLAAVLSATVGAVVWEQQFGFGVRIADLAIKITPDILVRAGLDAARHLPDFIEKRAVYGASVGFAAGGATIAAAATLAYRWRTAEWSRPDLLRAQMSCLLWLFAVSSLLLVFSNTAVRSLVEWPTGILRAPVAEVADAAGSKSAQTASDKKADTPGRPRAGAGPTLEGAIRSAAAGLSYLWSVSSTAILLVTFAPAFLSLYFDIEEAGTLAIRRRYRLTDVSYEELNRWKAENGLSLSFGEITTAALGTAAPLLTAPVIDLTKSLVASQGGG
jgi:uncharacterized membrane protein HdeD (DUF308 family)